MLRITALSLFILFIISGGYAQDSARKAAGIKPATKTYKYNAPKFNTAKTVVSTAQQPVVAPDDTADTTAPVDKSLNGQYKYLLSKIYHYQQPMLESLWKSARDTINSNKQNLKGAISKLAIQKKAIDSLKAAAVGKDKFLSAANSKVDEVDLLGIPMTKSSYNLLMWGLVVAFGITAFVVIARSATYSHEAKYRVKLYNELEEEYKAYKMKANDKEKKLARELQTERNKLDELLGRG
jgi:hypothetical protein